MASYSELYAPAVIDLRQPSVGVGMCAGPKVPSEGALETKPLRQTISTGAKPPPGVRKFVVWP